MPRMHLMLPALLLASGCRDFEWQLPGTPQLTSAAPEPQAEYRRGRATLFHTGRIEAELEPCG